MLKRLTFLFLTASLVTLGCFRVIAQENDSITLPLGGEALEVTRAIGFMELYITKDQHVYLNDYRLHTYESIPYEISRAYGQMRQNVGNNIRLVISADKDLPFSFIKKIKDTFCLIPWPGVLYRTNNLDWLNFISNRELSNCTWHEPKERIPEVREPVAEVPMEVQILTPPPPPPPLWADEQMWQFFNVGNKDSIERWIEWRALEPITVKPNRKFDYKGKEYYLSNEDKLAEIFDLNFGAYLFFDPELTYGDYLAFIEVKNRVVREREMRKMFIEMNQFVIDRLNSMGINLNN